MKEVFKKIIDRLTKENSSNQGEIFNVSSRNKTEDAIRFTIENYGETFRDLAKYDRGEAISR